MYIINQFKLDLKYFQKIALSLIIWVNFYLEAYFINTKLKIQLLVQEEQIIMKPAPKPIQKSPYNKPPVKLRAQIIPQKIVAKKPPTPQQSSSESSSESSSYDSEVQDFANEFYDEEVKNADKSLQEKKDGVNDGKRQGEQKENKQNSLSLNTKTKKPQTQWDKISSRLKQLKGNFNDLDMDALLFKKKDQNKLKQIAQFLSKKHKEKRDFMKKLKKIKNSQKQRRKIEQQMQKKKQKQEHEKRLKQIKNISKIIKEKIQKKKQEQQDRLEDIQAFYQQFHQKYQNRKIYKLMQLSDKKKRHQQLQKQQEYLKQRRNVVSQIISHQDIVEFNKRRQEYLKDSHKVKQIEKQQKTHEIIQKNRQLRDKIYISNKYLEMQQQAAKKQKIREIPKQKLNRIKKYNSHIKEHFMPQNAKNQQNEQNESSILQLPPQEQQVVEIDGKIYKKVKKDRYLKGQKIGEMIVNVPIAKTLNQQRMVGNSYLQQIKLLPKKRHSTSLDLSRKSQQIPKPKSTTPMPKIQKKVGKINLSKNADRHEIQNLINSLKAKDQLISRQQHYVKAVKKGVQNKEDLDNNLIDNIEKKINLLGRL